MMSSEEIARQRAMVVAEAKTWLRTPFHHEARVKGAGVDCAQLLAAVYHNAGVSPDLTIPHYPHDWHMHRNAERYLGIVLSHAVEMPGPPERTPQPGDVIVFKFGRVFSHGAIVIAWPDVIHAYVNTPVSFANVLESKNLQFIGETTDDTGKPRPMRVFMPKQWAE